MNIEGLPVKTYIIHFVTEKEGGGETRCPMAVEGVAHMQLNTKVGIEKDTGVGRFTVTWPTVQFYDGKLALLAEVTLVTIESIGVLA